MLQNLYRRRAAQAIRCVLALSLLIYVPSLAVATPVNFAIPAGDAPDTLSEFGTQSGLQMLFEHRAVASRHTNAVHGSYEPRKALMMLLDKSGLTYKYVNDVTVTILPAASDANLGGPRESMQLAQSELTPSIATSRANSESPSVPKNSNFVAPEPESGKLDEIVVTAQKRSQLAIETPLSVTALDAKSLAEHQVYSLDDLEFVSPGVTNGYTNGVNRLEIRGIGLQSYSSGADPSSAFYVDGIYIGRPSFQLTSFYDIERVEVVRGPQGTLYGRNATGGAVNVLTRSPTDDFTGYLDYTTGNYDLNKATGALSGPLNSSGSLLGRIAFNIQNHAGYGEDVAQQAPINNDNEQAVRGTLEFRPSEMFDFKLIWEYFHEADRNYFNVAFGAYPGYTLAGLLGPADPANGTVPAGIAVNSNYSQNTASALKGDTNRRLENAVTGIGRIQLSDTLHFDSITGWRKNDRHQLTESDGTSAGLGADSGNEETSNQVSQEFQLGYHDELWDAIAGLYYYHEYLTNFTEIPFIQLGPTAFYSQDGSMSIDAYAAFTQATFSVRPDFRVTLGARYSSETRDTTGLFQGIFVPVVPINEGKTWPAFTPKGAIEYDFTKDTLGYASVTRGFKSGTFNVGQVNPPVNPEKITAYELGIKSRLLDHKLEVTGAVFYYDYTNLQVNQIIGVATVTTNAAAAEDKGVELATRAKLTENLTLEANATYVDATFTSFNSINPLYPDSPAQDLSGNMLPGAPKISGGLGLAQSFPLHDGASVTAQAEAEYASRIYFSEFNETPISQAAVTKMNASTRFESANGRWSITAWGKNITNRQVASVKTLGIALWGYPSFGSLEPPATYGVTLGAKF